MIGGKARSLLQLEEAGFRVPPFFIVSPDERLEAESLQRRCRALSIATSDAGFAVRSSARAEDGVNASYAGMFETFLFVPLEEVLARIEEVRRSQASERVRVYERGRRSKGGSVPAVIVQTMVNPDVSGVAFGRDPVDGSDRAVIAATFGVGSGIVGGDCDADTYRVAPNGEIVERRIVRKETAHRRAPAGVDIVAVPSNIAGAAALTDKRVVEIYRILKSAEALFGSPQDVEWALCGSTLHVLQSRPVTTPAGTIWDNSNIAESYGGLVSPLTFSFARHAYATAYRELMRVFGIDRRTVRAHEGALENMLGLVDGHMYYNLLNWYELLALVPGFRLNRRFMESMMGVDEALPERIVLELSRKGKARDSVAVAKMILALTYRYARLNGDIAAFQRRVTVTLAVSPALNELSEAELHAEFARLEQSLLSHWQAPLVNDFFTMIAYGLLRALTDKWCSVGSDALHNGLLCAGGGMVSAEPARRVTEMASSVRGDGELIAALERGTVEEAVGALRPRAAFAQYAAYLDRFGDRCPNELKLESATLRTDPLPLLRAVAALAKSPACQSMNGAADRSLHAAEHRVAGLLRGRPLRSAVFARVLKHARTRLRDRENMRLERTRVFARVREIMIEIGKRLHESGRLANPRDVFFLELNELRSADVLEVARMRRELYDRYAALPPLPSRFTAIGAHAPSSRKMCATKSDPLARNGIGCCPGIVRGRARVVKDPRSPLETGEILVAERTDPGWVTLFPAAAGILVERGSVLSHAAIVSREMGIPSVVGIPGLTEWLHDGDLVEFDGCTGEVRRLGPGRSVMLRT